MTVEAHDDALAAQHMHDQQYAQYVRAAGKRRRASTAPTVTATGSVIAAATPQRPHDNVEHTEHENENQR